MEVRLVVVDVAGEFLAQVQQLPSFLREAMQLLDLVHHLVTPTQDPSNPLHLLNVSLIKLDTCLQQILDIAILDVLRELLEVAFSVDELHYSSRDGRLCVSTRHEFTVCM